MLLCVCWQMMRSGLEALDFLHRAGFCHNSVSSESLWMTTTSQQEINALALSLTNLGTCQKFVELGPQVCACGHERSASRGCVCAVIYL